MPSRPGSVTKFHDQRGARLFRLVAELGQRTGTRQSDGPISARRHRTESRERLGQTDRAGHVKGAHSVPFTSVTDTQLRVLPLAELKARFDAAGVAPGDTVIGYCHIGQQATAMLFAARLLGHPVKLYDGSFQDWSRGANNPVETTSAGGQQ